MIELRLNKDQFVPGQEISGEVSWSDLKESARIELRLIWYTAGKGTRDLEVVNVQPIDPAQVDGSQQFQLRAPDFPFSFSGKLISLVWAVEAVVLPSGNASTVPITIGPGGVEVVVLSKHPLDD